jgi:hypothetical protein
VEIVLAGYWQSFPSKQLKAGMIGSWADELQDWAIEQIVWALRKWRNENPDKRPNEGHILALLKDARGRKFAAALKRPQEEPRDERVSPERATAILEQAGFAVKRMA